MSWLSGGCCVTTYYVVTLDQKLHETGDAVSLCRIVGNNKSCIVALKESHMAARLQLETSLRVLKEMHSQNLTKLSHCVADWTLHLVSCLTKVSV